MMNDEMPRGLPMQPNRKQSYPPKYQEKPYSPSLSFNGNYNQNYNQGNFNQGQGQNPRRRFDRFKKEVGNTGGNSTERLIHQNESIIRLLKEIRDRLPPPPITAPAPAETAPATSAEKIVPDVVEIEKNESGAVEPENEAMALSNEQGTTDESENQSKD